MILDLTQLVLFGIACSATHWLIARSEIARPFWSRAGGWLGSLLACAGCSGFWIGGIIGAAGFISPVSLDVAPILYVDIALRALAMAVLGVFVTPVFEGVLLWGLQASALQASEETPPLGSIPEPVTYGNSGAYVTPVDSPIRRKTTP